MKTYLNTYLYALILLLALAAPSLAQSGSNLTTFAGDTQYVFDPTNEIPSAVVSRPLVLQTGNGWSAGTYPALHDNHNTGNACVYIAQYDCGAQGVHNIVCISQTPLSMASGGSWSLAPAPPVTIPTPAVHAAVTGPVSLLIVGDSISAHQGGTTQAALQAAYPNAASVACAETGVSGSATADWLPGGPNFTAAVSAGNSASATVASIMLGTNDQDEGVTPSQYASRMATIVAALRAQVPTLRYVVVQEMPALDPRGLSQATLPYVTTASNATLQSYLGSLSSGNGYAVGLGGMFGFFSNNPGLLLDGVHPEPGDGYAAVNYYWLTALAPYLSAAAAPPAPEALSPAGSTLAPNHTLQLSVSGLATGVIASSWAITGQSPAGVSVSSAGLLTYGAALPSKTTVTLKAGLSDGTFVSGTVSLSPTADTGSPDAPTLDTGLFGGTIGPDTNIYLNALIHNYGVPATMICLMICAWLLVRRWARSTPH